MQYVFILNAVCPNDLHPFPALHFETFQVFFIYFPKCPHFSTVQSPAPNVTLLTGLFLKFKVGYAGESSLLHVECCHGNLGFNLTCTCCIIYYHATQIVEIFHSLQLFLIYRVDLRFSLPPFFSHDNFLP